MKTFDYSADATQIVCIEKFCFECDNLNTYILDYDSVQKWERGMFIQDAFYYLTADQRDNFQTGICPDCAGNFYRTEFTVQPIDSLSEYYRKYRSEEEDVPMTAIHMASHDSNYFLEETF